MLHAFSQVKSIDLDLIESSASFQSPLGRILKEVTQFHLLNIHL
jgi:hypothetical protein